MANPPELVAAFNLIKAGQKTEAGRILKAYLSQNKQDVQAWWLMAHAASKPEVIQRCLETILKLDPNHEKARAQLAKLTGQSSGAASSDPAPQAAPQAAPPPAAAPAPPSPPPAAAPADDPFAPTADDDPFAPSAAAPAAAPAPPPAAAPADDPFAPTADDDPFAPSAAVPADDPFAPSADDPFAPTADDDPFASSAAVPADDPFAPTADDDPFAPSAAVPADDPFAAADDPFASAPVDDYGFPDDALVLANVLPAAPAPEPKPAAAPAVADAPGSFEDFLSGDADDDPFAGPPVDDPFAESSTSEDLFATSAGTRGSKPRDAASTGPAAPPPKPPGGDLNFEVHNGTEVTGAPPGGIPGKRKNTPILTDDDLRVTKRRKGGGGGIMSILALFLVFFVVLLGLFLYAAVDNGFIDLDIPGVGGEHVPDMTTMDASTFTMSIPKDWDQKCLVDAYGYPVCGVANHRWYNEAEYFAGTQIDLSGMIGEMFAMSLTGEELPEEQFSIIAMDVLDYSPSYDNRSWAKTMYEWDQEWSWFGNDKSNYEKYETEIEGHQAYYYEFVSTGNWKQAAWDVYIPHDGRIFWFRVDYSGERKNEIPYKTVAKMIESIHFKEG